VRGEPEKRGKGTTTRTVRHWAVKGGVGTAGPRENVGSKGRVLDLRRREQDDRNAKKEEKCWLGLGGPVKGQNRHCPKKNISRESQNQGELEKSESIWKKEQKGKTSGDLNQYIRARTKEGTVQNFSKAGRKSNWTPNEGKGGVDPCHKARAHWLGWKEDPRLQPQTRQDQRSRRGKRNIKTLKQRRSIIQGEKKGRCPTRKQDKSWP